MKYKTFSPEKGAIPDDLHILNHQFKLATLLLLTFCVFGSSSETD